MIITIAFLIILLLANLNVASQVFYSTSATTYSAYGLSTDTKPLSPPDNCFYIEKNTGNSYRSLGGVWILITLGKDTVANYYMPIQRASDSINSIKTSIATKLPSSSFTKAAMVALGMVAVSDTSAMLSPYLRTSVAATMYQPVLGFTPVTNARTLTINGSTQDLSANRTWNVGTLVGSDSTNFRAYSNTLYEPKISWPNTTLKYVTGYNTFGSFNDSARRAVSLTNTGSGNATYDNTTGIFNIPNNTFSTNAKADNATKGIATFDSSYFNDNGSGLISLGLNNGAGTVSANAVTINAPKGTVTLSTSILAAANFSFTLTNSYITSTSNISIQIGSNTATLTLPLFAYVKSKANGSAVINLLNVSLLGTFNTAIVIDFVIIN